MKANRLQEKIAAGEVPVGHMIMEFGTRGIAKMLEHADVDFVLIDTEHSPFSVADLADLMAWFKATTLAPFVRIPQIDYHFIARTLDMGALGLMIPNVKSAAEARAIVDAAKYAPLGKRGLVMNHAHTDYRPVHPPEFMDYSNRNTTIICQIESVEGLGELDAIASTPGVDMLWVGHFDLTQSLGIPGQFNHPTFHAAMRQVAETAKKHGLTAGIQPGSAAQAREWLAFGFNVLSYSADFAVYTAAVRAGVAEMRQLAIGQ